MLHGLKENKEADKEKKKRKKRPMRCRAEPPPTKACTRRNDTHSQLFGFAVRHSAHDAQSKAAAAAAGEGRDRLFAFRVRARESEDTLLLSSWLGERRVGQGEEGWAVLGGRGGGPGRRARTAADCSVPRGPVALGHRVGDVQEGGAHQVEGLVAQGRHVVRRHALRLDLGQDLQPDGSWKGGDGRGKRRRHECVLCVPRLLLGPDAAEKKKQDFDPAAMPGKNEAPDLRDLHSLPTATSSSTSSPDLNCFSFRR